MDWPKLMQMNWPSVAWLRTTQDVTDAAKEIGAKFQRLPNNDEVSGAVRWLADGGHKGEKPPSLRELIGAIRFRRKESWEARKAADVAQSGPCWLCKGTGWAPCRPKMVTQPLYSCDVPCTCPAGEAQMDKGKAQGGDFYGLSAEKMQNIDAHRRLAYRQGCDTDAGRAAVGRDQVARDQESDAMLAEDGLA